METFRSNVEGKYTVDIADEVLLSMLECLCEKDDEHPSDGINSVYFDTPTLLLLDQKVNSEYRKNKVRLRWYGTSNAGPTVKAYLEIKQKNGVQRNKRRQEFELPASLFEPGNESFSQLEKIADHAADLGFAPVGPLFPMIVIRYHRHRFTEPMTGARISLDRRIGYTKVNSAFFPEREPRMLRHGVLEIKSSTGEIPRSMAVLQDRVNARDSFSKYEECWNIYADTNYRRDLVSTRYD